MGIIADVLNLLRPPIPPDDDVISPAPTIADFRAGLDRMALEEGEALQLIAAAPQRRTELLLQEGSDAAIRKLEQAVDRAHLQVERITALRPELHARIRALQVASRTDAWFDFRTRMVEQLTVCAIMQASADAAAAKMRALKLEALNAGYRVETEVIPFSMHGVPAASFADMARSLARVVAYEPPPAALIYNVRFFEWTAVTFDPRAGPVGYMAQQEAGFDAETARLLIERGVAELADPKPLPPAPPKKRPERRRTAEERMHLAELRAGGRLIETPPADPPPAAPPPPEHPRAWTPLDQLPGGV